MNEQPNAPMLSSGSSSIFQTWMNAITKPNEQTYVQIAASPEAKLNTALLWVFVGSLVQSLIGFILQGTIMRQMMQNSGLEVPAVAPSLIGVLCGAPVAAVMSVAVFAVFTGIVQWVAGLFGGTGSFEKLAYVLAAITVPFSLIGSLLTLLAVIPYVGWCLGIVGFFAGLYVLVLQVMAVKAVNQFGWGPAAGSLLLPFFVLLCCIFAVIFALAAVLGPAMQDIFNQINQSLMP
jgi:hypothetical protein